MLVGVLVAILFVKTGIDAGRRKRARFEMLVQRYGPVIAARIERREVWQGMTREMLIESIGSPDDVDQSVLKTRVRLVMKYQRVGKNRFRRRIIVENDVVVGWEER